MDPLSRLPIECLQGHRSRTLVRTLLSSIPPANLPSGLTFEFELDPTDTEPTRSQFDYLRHLRHFNLGTFTFRDYSQLWGHKKFSDKELHYIQEHEASWSIAAPIFEQLESLTIALSDIHRYHEAIKRLERLEHVRFLLDIVFGDSAIYRSPVIESTKLLHDQAVRSMLDFVKDHARLFQGRLKNVVTSDCGFGRWGSRLCLGQILQEIYWVLPPIHPPTSLDQHNWPRVSVHPLSTDLSRVRLICYLGDAMINQQVLPRCRSLKELRVQSLGQGNFDWAVQEKNEVERLGQGLVDSHGLGWIDLPALTSLDLRTPRHRLEMDELLLSHCPNVTNVKVADETSEYSCQAIVPCLTAHLPQLKVLSLRGWSALTFHPATLHSTTDLRFLRLAMKRTDCCFIPPVDELNRSYGLEDDLQVAPPSIVRPQWTWDWYLPQLTDLQLTSEFAYLFQFKMLQRCSALEDLRLKMRTNDGDHTRQLTEADLFVSGASSQERIVAPALRNLDMVGHWVIENPVILSQFLGLMFPVLGRLVIRGWEGVTVGSLVKVLRTTASHISIVGMDLAEPTMGEMVDLRINPHPHGSKRWRDPRTFQTRIYCPRMRYVLLKDDA
ncbi:hypothetical protein BGX33_004840 [Mortierella sp. NVP41]|nr:hypothetical protein BGX33_004840 [Mortierella sp. NVP41]